MKVSPVAKILLWVVLGSVSNVVLGTLDRALGLPLFFDSIFTAVVAALYGPLWGSLTALLSQSLLQVSMAVFEHQAWGPTIPFVLCQLVTALVIGFMAKSGRFKTPFELIVAIVAVALGNSVVGSLVATFVFGGLQLGSVDFISAGLIIGGQSLLEATFWARVPINLFDKGIAVFTAFLLLQARRED